MRRQEYAIAIVFAIISLGSVIVLLVGYYSLGQADKSARLSSLLVLRRAVVESARTQRRYAAQLGDAVADPRVSEVVDLGTLEYLASNQPYVERTDGVLFRERQARTYGWERGWYEIRQEGWTFHTGDPCCDSAESSSPSAKAGQGNGSGRE